MIRRLIAAAIILLVAHGCTQGVAEFGIYAEAYQEQRVIADDVLSRLGKAERALFRRSDGLGAAFPPFDPDNAGYYVEVGDPPITASFRASIMAVDSYNAALLSLARGEGADAYLSATQQLAGDLDAAAAALGVAEIAGSAVAGGAAALGPVGAALGVVKPLAELALEAASREEFRARLLAVKPEMDAFLLKLRDASTLMFEVMKRAAERNMPLAEGGGAVIDDAEALWRDRAALAGWVLLLDRSKLALDAAAAAAASPYSASSRAALLDASVGLKALTATIKAAQ